MGTKVTKPALSQLKGWNNLIGAEIGVASGIHASCFLLELDIDMVYLIDPYITYKDEYETVKLERAREMESNAYIKLAKYKHKIRWIKKKSVDAAKFIASNSLNFVYIDANHTYKSVAEDILSYYPKVKKGGLFSGHDYDYESVKRAVDEFINNQNLKLYTERIRCRKYDWWAWK